MTEREGTLIASGQTLAIVVARFNHFVTERLLEGALDAFERHGGDPKQVDVVRVPGAFELPLAVKALAASRRYQGVVALAAVIRGATPHFDYVSSSATSGLSSVMLETGIPVGFGVLTTDTVEQAIDRAGAKSGNKGADALMTVVEMVNLLKSLS
ncbi:MAG: 6,7-dimethyl-8-ribityllumazine synthase [Deltaproteobacteria bacterium]|nr:6,7-dimethyl-8-ribityllumazine synthase [Deltaproteobacteria bacterium]